VAEVKYVEAGQKLKTQASGSTLFLERGVRSASMLTQYSPTREFDGFSHDGGKGGRGKTLLEV